MRFADGLYPEQAFRKVGGRMTYEGGGKGGGQPAAPDYKGAAAEQAAGSKEVTNLQNYANRPNQITPWGSSTWDTSMIKDPSTGQNVTQWTQNLNVRPDAQAALDAQLGMERGRSELAESTMPRVANDIANPWDFSQFTARAGGNMQAPNLNTSRVGPTTGHMDEGAFSADRDAYIAAQRELMRPTREQHAEQLDARLANQGLTEGSAAYINAHRDQNDQFARDDLQAIAGGQAQQLAMRQALLASQGQEFNQGVTSQSAENAALQNQQGADITGANFTNQLRMQEIAEEAQRRGLSLNEMNALITGQQVQTPQMPGFVAASRADGPQSLQAAQLQGQNALDAFNIQQARAQSQQSGLFSLGGAAVGGFFGGPMGAMVGSQVGGKASSLFG